MSFFSQAAMAECDPLESLQKEASCSICLDYFSDPVSINCGHSFCRDCITRCSGKSDRRFACPQCRGIAQKRKFRPNRELRNLAEIAKKLISRVGDAARAGGVCPKHQEPLKLFCQEDQTAICVVCDRSQAHRAHTVAPIEEAAQECKVRDLQCFSPLVFPPLFFPSDHQRLRTTPRGFPHLLKDTAKDARLGFPKIQDKVGQSCWIIQLDQGLFAAPKPIPKSSSLHLTQPPHPTGAQMHGDGHSLVWGHSGGIGGGGVLGLIRQNLLPGSKGWVKPDFHPDLQKGDFTLSFPPCTPFTENHQFIYSHPL